jgi:hypothetical protein
METSCNVLVTRACLEMLPRGGTTQVHKPVNSNKGQRNFLIAFACIFRGLYPSILASIPTLIIVQAFRAIASLSLISQQSPCPSPCFHHSSHFVRARGHSSSLHPPTVCDGVMLSTSKYIGFVDSSKGRFHGLPLHRYSVSSTLYRMRDIDSGSIINR